MDTVWLVVWQEALIYGGACIGLGRIYFVSSGL